ncbi:hypothetical protein ACFWP7_01695 [Streptomyces sp. NPDC058470]|uniref:hypothetical protein n=1 Tax=Streptomyces sp. NPDC058470 TaxID=3346515 RepID=UPI003668FBB5
MPPTQPPTAWDDPQTRRAWTKLIACAIAGQVIWPVVWVGLLAAYVIMSITWTLWLFFIPMLYSFYRAFLQPAYFTWALRTRRILQEYPWQAFEAPESGIGTIPDTTAGDVWLSFPHPERSDEMVPVVLRVHIRSAWWRRRLGRGFSTEKTAQAKTVWFAGDPRFAAVIAVPGPRRLYVIHQRPSYGKSMSAEAAGATPQALDRARRAGIHVSDPHSAASGTPGT